LIIRVNEKERSSCMSGCLAPFACSDEEDQGDEMTDAGEVDEQMPDEMEIGVLWLGIEECAGRVHEPAQDDEDEEQRLGALQQRRKEEDGAPAHHHIDHHRKDG